MRLTVEPSRVSGSALMPSSKSHTIRAVTIGMLARGTSVVRRPLDSLDARSAAAAARQLGAGIDMKDGGWTITGTGGRPRPPKETIDVGNSGTTLRLMLSAAALAPGRTVFTGDEQIQRRPVGPLLEAIGALGARAVSHRGNGCAPCEVTGPIRGGNVRIACRDSQYLSSLLISTPLARGETRITVTELNERPYVEMTLWWLERSGIELQRDGLERFRIPGGQGYGPFEMEIPGDWSSATFFMAAAALVGGTVELRGLCTNDHQGDMRVADVLEAMGARVERGAGRIRVTGAALRGGEFDLNDIPDSLPSLAVAAACAEGRTRLVNIPQARLKETDRIRVMAEELPRMGARVKELPDGLEIDGGALRGAGVSGRGDHRIVMALAVAGLVAKGRTVIDTAEAMAVTFPEFVRLMQGIGAAMRTED